LGHALFEPRYAIRKNRLAFARQLLLGVEEIQQVARVPIVETARAARERARERDEHCSCDQALRAVHGRFPTAHLLRFCSSSWRQAAALPAAPRHANEGMAVAP